MWGEKIQTLRFLVPFCLPVLPLHLLLESNYAKLNVVMAVFRSFDPPPHRLLQVPP